MSTVTLEDMLKAGVHFGHRASRWNPKMQEYIYTKRGGIHVIDLSQTKEKLEEAQDFMKGIATKGGTVLFLGTKRQAAPSVEKAAKRCGMPYITERWLGGTLTNFKEIHKQIKKLLKYLEQEKTGDLEKYTKRERLMISREVERLEKNVGGLKTLEKLPDALFVIDLKREHNAIAEAKTLGIPVIGFADTNVDPRDLAYPIPANDDGVKAIELMMNVIADSIVTVTGEKAEVTEEKTEDKKEEKAEETSEEPQKEESSEEDSK